MKALSVKSYSELQQLVAGQIPTVEAKLVDRAVADNVENGLRQLVPYVVFYNMDVPAGKLKFIQYLRAAAPVAEGEEPVASITSIGFGRPIEVPANIRSQETIIGEDGETSYAMTLQDIMDTVVTAGLTDVLELTGLDVKAVLGDVIDHKQLAFFVSDVPMDELKVRTGIAIPVPVTAEQFELIRTSVTLNPVFIEKLDTLGINIDRIVEEMDITPTIDNVVNELVGKYNLEPWSTMMFNYIVRKELFEMMKEISYNDIVALVHAKRAALVQIAEQEALRQRVAAEAVAQTTQAPAADAPAEEVAEQAQQTQG